MKKVDEGVHKKLHRGDIPQNIKDIHNELVFDFYLHNKSFLYYKIHNLIIN